MLTRVLKGCVKAAGWGVRDGEGRGKGDGQQDGGQMSIKCESKKIKVRVIAKMTKIVHFK